jgi:hypothetical protein
MDIEKLRGMIRTCEYQPQYKMTVEQHVVQALVDHPRLAPKLISFRNSAGKEIRILEVAGEVEVNYKEKGYLIRLSACLPQSYPKDHPLLKVTNPNPALFYTSENYKPKLEGDSYGLPLDPMQTNGSLPSFLRLACQIMAYDFPFRRLQQQMPPQPQPFHAPSPLAPQPGLAPDQLEKLLAELDRQQVLCKDFVRQFLQEYATVENKVQRASIFLQQVQAARIALEQDYAGKLE